MDFTKSNLMIHNFIAISIYCITYLRNLFSDDNYQDSKYIDSNDDSEYIRTKQLVKGVSATADLLIDCIEVGIKKAIEDRFLQAIQLIICNGSDKTPQESYLFIIGYHNSTIKINSDVFKADCVLSQMQQVMRKLIVLTQSFESKFISSTDQDIMVSLLFNYDCPSEYQPVRFINCNHSPTIKMTRNSESVSLHDAGALCTEGHKLDIWIFTSSDDENTIDIDPFDTVMNSSTVSFEQLPPSSTPLSNKVVSSKPSSSGHTTKLPLPETFCKSCKQNLDITAYGYTSTPKIPIQCYKCMFKFITLDMTIVMKVRKLWHYISTFGIPASFEQFIEVMHPSIDANLIIMIINFFFRYNILIIIDKENFSPEEMITTFVSTVDGIVSNEGTKLIMNHEYHIGFVPCLIEKYPLFSYNTQIYKLLFPNYRTGRKGFIEGNLNKFMSLFYETASNQLYHTVSSSYISDSMGSYGVLGDAKYLINLKYNNQIGQFKRLQSSSSTSQDDLEPTLKNKIINKDQDHGEMVIDEPLNKDQVGMSLSESIDYLSSQQPPTPLR